MNDLWHRLAEKFFFHIAKICGNIKTLFVVQNERLVVVVSSLFFSLDFCKVVDLFLNKTLFTLLTLTHEYASVRALGCVCLPNGTSVLLLVLFFLSSLAVALPFIRDSLIWMFTKCIFRSSTHACSEYNTPAIVSCWVYYLFISFLPRFTFASNTNTKMLLENCMNGFNFALLLLMNTDAFSRWNFRSEFQTAWSYAGLCSETSKSNNSLRKWHPIGCYFRKSWVRQWNRSIRKSVPASESTCSECTVKLNENC